MYMPQTYEQLSVNFPMCKATFCTIISEIRQEIQAGRYSQCTLIDEKPVRVSPLVFIDYMANRKMLKDKNARKYVHPFNAADLRDNYPIAPDSEEIAEIVIERIGYTEKGVRA